MTDWKHIEEAILDVAPECASRNDVGRRVNEALDLDWSVDKWKGIFRRKPRLRDEVNSLLGSVGEPGTLQPLAERWSEIADDGPPILSSTTGHKVEEIWPDEEEVFRRAVAVQRSTFAKMEKKGKQSIEFNKGPVALVFMGDQHLGSSGTDYERCFAEAEIVADTPGMYAVTMGDMLDQFVIGRLRQARDNSRLAIVDEWALVRKYIRTLGDSLVASVGGNHDAWATLLTGVDYFADTLRSLRPDVIYDSDDCTIDVVVGERTWTGRLRHQWQGSSIYNPTHGIERAAKWDQGFVFGVGAHTHVSGVARSFNVGGRSGMAALVGAYKRHDAFARRMGFARPNNSTAITIVFDEETGSMTGFEDLEFAARFMETMYG